MIQVEALSGHQEIVGQWRARQDLKRAQQRLDLQCQSVVRGVCEGDKVKASKLWGLMRKDADASSLLDDTSILLLEDTLLPYRAALDALAPHVRSKERILERMAREHPLWTAWGRDVRGVGELTLAGLLGEAGRPLEAYRSPACLWKRFGVGLVDGSRQRLIAGDPEAVIRHGYSPRRRAFGYVVAENLIRTQKRDDPYRLIYDETKKNELEVKGLTKSHAHARALRKMFKTLLRDGWIKATA